MDLVDANADDLKQALRKRRQLDNFELKSESINKIMAHLCWLRDNPEIKSITHVIKNDWTTILIVHDRDRC